MTTINYQTEITFADTTISCGTYWTIEEARKSAQNGKNATAIADGWRIRNLTTGDIIERSK
jgi:hypothetical protein